MKYSIGTILSVGCIAGLLVLSGCSGDSKNNSNDSSNVTVLLPLTDEALEQIDGVWEQRGYGSVYKYDGNRTTLYALTENTCLEVSTDPGFAGLGDEEIAESRYNLKGDQLSLVIPGDAFETRLDRLESLPTRCADTVASDVQGVFDYVWQTFDEYYAFFDLRNVDWPAEYERQLPRIGGATDNDSLFGLLSDLLSPIDDGHVFLFSEDDGFSPAVERGIEQEIQQSFEAQSEVTDINEWEEMLYDKFTDLIEARLDVDSIQEHGPLIWGTANEGSVGYMLSLEMEGYVLDSDGESIGDVSTAEDLNAASAAMDRAIADLANTSRLVIDARLNGGGNDSISLNFAQRFVSERRLAFTKTARSRDYESMPVEEWLEPQTSGAYLNPVTLIVGADTGSAAEIFAISMSNLPQVEVIGESTEGILSDVLVKPLPNGWVVGLSNEVYLDAQGVSYEGVGLTPDVELQVNLVEEVQAGTDSVLERALAR